MPSKFIKNIIFQVFTLIVLGSLTSGLVKPAHARAQAAQPDQTQSSLNLLLQCRIQTDNVARLACFDSQAAIVAQQTATGELVPVYGPEIAATRRGLFGIDSLKVPNFLSNQEDRLEQVSTTLISARQGANGRWRFHLEDGSVWEQIDSTNPHLNTREGTRIEIRRGALNSYLMNVGTARAIRVSRRS